MTRALIETSVGAGFKPALHELARVPNPGGFKTRPYVNLDFSECNLLSGTIGNCFIQQGGSL